MFCNTSARILRFLYLNLLKLEEGSLFHQNSQNICFAKLVKPLGASEQHSRVSDRTGPRGYRTRGSPGGGAGEAGRGPAGSLMGPMWGLGRLRPTPGVPQGSQRTPQGHPFALPGSPEVPRCRPASPQTPFLTLKVCPGYPEGCSSVPTSPTRTLGFTERPSAVKPTLPQETPKATRRSPQG